MSPSRPNFLLILADDLGHDDLGLSGNRFVSTPHLDRLGRESLRFTNFTVNPVCAPSRATLLTGRHFLRTGVAHVHGGKDFLSLRERTVADVLRVAGYATGMWGKWHSGYTDGYLPWQRGFDEAVMLRLYRHEEPTGSVNGRPVAFEGWADAVIADQAIDFLRRHRDESFFAFVPSMTPHAPLAAPEECIAPYEAKGLSRALATLYGMVTHLDAQVARILDALDELGLRENTVVLFLSDNGPAFNDDAFTDEDRALRRTDALRGFKGDIWENGVRSPLYVSWPGVVAPGECAAPVEMADLLPTLLELAGPTATPGPLPLDGRSLAPFLRGEGAPPGRLIFNYANRGWPPSKDLPYSPEGHHDEYRPVAPEEKPGLRFDDQVVSVQDGRFKLLCNPAVNTAGTPEREAVLVDLSEDPGEIRNLIGQYPEVAARLRHELHAWFDEMRREPESFSAPTLTVAAEPGAPDRLPAKCPMRVGGALRNTVQRLGNWSRAGQFADYRVHVLRTRDFALQLEWTGEVPTGWRVELSASGCAVTALRTSGGWDWSGPLRLGEGLQELRVRLLATPGEELPSERRPALDAIVLS